MINKNPSDWTSTKTEDISVNIFFIAKVYNKDFRSY